MCVCVCVCVCSFEPLRQLRSCREAMAKVDQVERELDDLKIRTSEASRRVQDRRNSLERPLDDTDDELREQLASFDGRLASTSSGLVLKSPSHDCEMIVHTYLSHVYSMFGTCL
jgi:hypothetical protein